MRTFSVSSVIPQSTFDRTLRNIKKEGGKSGQLESQWGMNLTTVFQFKFMQRHFTSSPVKFHCWFKMFWLLVCWSFVSFIIPKSFKPGQRFGFCLSNRNKHSLGWYPVWTEVISFKFGTFRGHNTALLQCVRAKLRVRGEGAVGPPEAAGFSQADPVVVYGMWWLGFQIYVKNGPRYLRRDGRRGGDSTLGGVFTRAYPSVKLSLMIRVVEADYLR